MIAQLLAEKRRSRLRVGITAAVVLLIVGLGIAVLVSALSSAGVTRTIAPAAQLSGPAASGGAPTSATAPASGAPASGTASARGAALFVHILGAVASPGLYQLHQGDRAVDAVAAAGGFTAEADRAQLNLARLVSDGEQIYVPKVGEAGTGPPGSSPAAGSDGGKVNINTASESELETLPRVGPTMAKRIIAWRQANGRFTAVEDLMSVTGIGEKTFAELKDLVTV